MRWVLRNADPQQVQRLALETNLPLWHGTSPGCLAASERGEQAQKFLSPSLQDLHDPYLMTGLRAAVERLNAAIERGETILIYGDYDVDGTTAIVILKTAIELCGGKVGLPRAASHSRRLRHARRGDRAGGRSRHSPDHQRGYRHSRLRRCRDSRAPAASTSSSPITICPQAEGVPKALAVLNPNQPDCDYPCKSLCGAGVAFKLAQALLVEELARERLLPSFLKMVAIATIADAVPLIGENRVFAKLGLDGLRKPVNPGLRALLANCADSTARVRSAPATSPSASRPASERRRPHGHRRATSSSCSREKDPGEAAEMAMQLNQLNGDRQQEERAFSTRSTGRSTRRPS